MWVAGTAVKTALGVNFFGIYQTFISQEEASNPQNAVDAIAATAKGYYDSDNAFNFYRQVRWPWVCCVCVCASLSTWPMNRR